MLPAMPTYEEIAVVKIYAFIAVSIVICIGIQAQHNPRAALWLRDADGDNIPGRAGLDYPVHAAVPRGTRFRCSDYDYAGYFGDVEAGCQAYHVCFPDGRNASFLCVNGTVFHQRFFVCDWWFHFECGKAPKMYELNLFRKIPLPVLPPPPRRPFPGPAPQPQLRGPKNLVLGEKDETLNGKQNERDKKQKDTGKLQVWNQNAGNKYRNPVEKENPLRGGKEDQCNCQCAA